jgi:hypothetical protein
MERERERERVSEFLSIVSGGSRNLKTGGRGRSYGGSEVCLKAPNGSRAKPQWGSRGQAPRKLTDFYKHKVFFFKFKIIMIYKMCLMSSNRGAHAWHAGAGSAFDCNVNYKKK